MMLYLLRIGIDYTRRMTIMSFASSWERSSRAMMRKIIDIAEPLIFFMIG